MCVGESGVAAVPMDAKVPRGTTVVVVLNNQRAAADQTETPPQSATAQEHLLVYVCLAKEPRETLAGCCLPHLPAPSYVSHQSLPPAVPVSRPDLGDTSRTKKGL